MGEGNDSAWIAWISPHPLISWGMLLIFLFIHFLKDSFSLSQSHRFAVVGKKQKPVSFTFQQVDYCSKQLTVLCLQATYCTVPLQQLSLSGRRVNNDKRKQDTLWSHWCSKTKYGVIFFLRRRNFINVFSSYSISKGTVTKLLR